MSEELKPCLHCGNTKTRIIADDSVYHCKPLYYACCTSCGIRTINYDTKQEAIEGHWRWINDAKHLTTVVEIADGENRRYTNEGTPKIITLIRTRSTMLQ